MSLNSGAINTFAVNAAPVSNVIGTGAGELISIEQKVAHIGGGELISIEQVVQLRLSSSVSENFISFEQSVRALYTGEIISIEQSVKDPAVVSRVDRMGWDATLVIGGQIIPGSEVHGMISINRTENDASLMSVTLIPGAGTQDITDYHGKSVTLDVETVDGIFRVFTGSVDIPQVDLIEEKITLQCTDRRTEQLNAQLPGVVSTIGVYSSKIFSTPKDTAEEVEQRLTTTPYSVDFDAYGNYTITSWTPKATADFTLTDADVYRDKPVVEFSSRGRITNNVVIKFPYRYDRRYHHSRLFTWTSLINNNICLVLRDGYSLTSKAMVKQAAQSAGWKIDRDISYTAIAEPGWYRCSGTLIGWSTTQITGNVVATTDESGNTISDASGNTVYETDITSFIDYNNLYCTAASWRASTRWAQTITESHTLTVSAPQSIAQFGTITQELNFAIDNPADSSDWESNLFYENTSSNNYYVDDDTERSAFELATVSALGQAQTTILNSHRDTRVAVDTFVWPQVDLKHTVAVNTDEVTSKGKVFSIEHTLNINTGEARTKTTLILSKASGSTTPTALSPPSKPSDSASLPTNPIRLGNHFGEDPTTERARAWTGMIGNKWVTVNDNTFRTTYQEQFVVDTPGVPDIYRTERTLSNSTGYTVEIPDDTLTITFDGKV